MDPTYQKEYPIQSSRKTRGKDRAHRQTQPQKTARCRSAPHFPPNFASSRCLFSKDLKGCWNRVGDEKWNKKWDPVFVTPTSWFFMVTGWFFMVPGWFFMVPGGLSWFFMVAGWFSWFQVGFHVFFYGVRLVFHCLRWEHPKTVFGASSVHMTKHL